MEVRRNIAYGEEPEQLLDVYMAERADKMLVFFHGGGLESGTKEENADAFHVLAQNGVNVVSVEYRMYPRAGYPDFIEDGARAAGWVSRNAIAKASNHAIAKASNHAIAKASNHAIAKASNHAIAKASNHAIAKASRIAKEQGLPLYVGGSSAGAYIAMMLAFDPSYLKPYGIDKIHGYIFDAGQPTTHFRVLKERGFDPRRIVVDSAAPLYHVGTVGEVPPILILAADNDISGRVEQLSLLAKTLEDFGHRNVTFRVLEGFSHCGYCHADDGEGNLFYPKILLDFLNRQE